MADKYALSLRIYFIIVLFAVCSVENRKSTYKVKGRCAKTPIPMNGIITKSKVIKKAMVAWYKCNEGYILHGSNLRVCMPGQGWSGSVKCLPPPTKPPTTLSPQQKKVKANIQKLTQDAIEVGETVEGKELMIAVGVSVLVILLLAIHCGRVAATRKSLKTKYDDVMKTGDKPRKDLPSFCQVSSDILKTTFCCQDSELPKSFKPRKEKKKKKKDKYKDELNEKLDFRSDKNMNSTMQRTRPRQSYFRADIGRHGNTYERYLLSKSKYNERHFKTEEKRSRKLNLPRYCHQTKRACTPYSHLTLPSET